MGKVIVIIGDIESSQELPGKSRNAVQQKLKKVLSSVNREGDHVLSPYTITLGDEFQGVLSCAADLFTHIWRILGELYPVKVRFSIAVGDVSTSINREQALGMDGPAFHEARAGINRLKNNGYLFNLRAPGCEGPVLNVLNDSLHLLSEQVRDWNENRIKIPWLLTRGMDYKAIAEELNISEQAYYKNMEAASLDVVIDLGRNISEIIDSWVES